MFIKTFIFDSYYCMLQIYGNLFDGYRQTVGTWCCQFTKLIAVPVIQKGSIPQWGNINVIYIRSIIYNSPKSTDTYAANYHADCDQSYKQNSDKRNMGSLSHHSCTGNQGVSFL